MTNRNALITELRKNLDCFLIADTHMSLKFLQELSRPMVMKIRNSNVI
jgi:hypothetical protein